MPPASGRYNGLVRTAVGGAYEVELHEGTVIEAVLRGRLKRERRTGDAVVPGDRVEVERHADGSHTIERVAERRTELARRAPGRRRAKVLVANIDQMVVVFAVAEPAPRLRMLDRFLVLAESNGLEAVVVANKIDLGGSGQVETFEAYREVGYPVLATSTRTGDGVAELRDALRGRVSTLVGPSGAGKSSLLNAIEPGLGLRTASVSEAIGKGRHTTVSATLIPLDCGGYVADTPGLRELGLWGVDRARLDHHFPELRPYLGRCRYDRSCTHTHEPGCAVRDAVEAGEVSEPRYESYRAMLEGEEW